MDDRELRERYGQVFDAVAEEYSAARRSYPDELVDAAVARGGLTTGDLVLEVGCGTGHLTAALLAQGLRVEAVDPGENMIRMARQRVDDSPAVRFHCTTFEAAALPEGEFAALFAATSFHWVVPEVGWARAAEVLRPRGMLALLQFTDARDERTRADDEAMQAALAKVAPEIAANWPEPRDADTIVAGAHERSGNISEVWSWISRHQLAAPEAGELFDDVQITTVPLLSEFTADRLNRYMRTTSLYARLGPEAGPALEAENQRIGERLGGRIRLSELAVLVTGRRVA